MCTEYFLIYSCSFTNEENSIPKSLLFFGFPILPLYIIKIILNVSLT